MESNEKAPGDDPRLQQNMSCLLATYGLEKLRPHPSYNLHRITVSASHLSALAEHSESVLQEPLAITQDGIVLDGYARLKLAQHLGRVALPCIQYQMSKDEALRSLIQRHCRSKGLNDFCRISLALDLEPGLREKALSNQCAGGKYKLSSNLSEAQKLNVRHEIAATAQASVGNVAKVKQLLQTAHPDLLEALRNGEIRIHRAWLWAQRSPTEQQEQLWQFRSQQGVKKAIKTLVSRHRSKALSPVGLFQPVRQNLKGTRMVIRKRYTAEVGSNDGEFAEVQTCGVEGVDKDMGLDMIRIHREDTPDSPEEFKRRFPVSAHLDILITTEIDLSSDEVALTGRDYDQDREGSGSVQITMLAATDEPALDAIA